MESLIKSLWVGLGAFLGGVARFWIGEVFRHSSNSFPWSTFGINVVGSLLIGSFYAWELKGNPATAYRLFFAVGICGGFTTFSTFSWETLRLMEKGQWIQAVTYAVASVLLTVATCAGGFYLTRMAISG